MPEGRERGLDYQDQEEPEHRKYSPEQCPETKRQLDFLAELARYDEGERSLTHSVSGRHPMGLAPTRLNPRAGQTRRLTRAPEGNRPP